MQHPRRCENGKLFIYHLVYSGIGSNLHVVSSALGYALSQGRTLIVAGSFHFAEPSIHCKEPTLACYFLPITNCTLENISVSDQNAMRLVETWVPHAQGNMNMPEKEWPKQWQNKGTFLNPIFLYPIC